ncbi:MAG TPA: SRPBCC family protein [Steroidobacteraceae bacterium]
MSAVTESMPSGEARNHATVTRLERLAEQTGLDRLDQRRINRALGWFSVGLGLAQILAPRNLGRLIGAGEDHETVMRLCGLREIASGIGLLSERAPAASALSRVAGDTVDLALLGAALRSPDAHPGRLLVAATTVLGVTAVDLYAAGREARTALAEADEDIPVRVSLAINASPERLYEFWRNFENLPRFMQHLQSVTRRSDGTSHWISKASGDLCLEWDSEVVDDQPNSLIAWRTLPGSQVKHHGSVLFEPAGDGKGTIVYVDVAYAAPGGQRGAALAKIFGSDPELHIARDLRSLKQLLETGEIATTRGQSSGARSLLGRTLTRSEP